MGPGPASESLKLEFLKVVCCCFLALYGHSQGGTALQIVGFTHMRIADGVTTQLQLSGMLAKLCLAASKSTWKPATAVTKK